MPSSITFVVLGALLALPTFVAPLQDWEEQVADQIAAIHDEIAPDFEYASDLVIGEIEPGESDGFTITVHGDAQYILVGVCDADCGDLDLAIYDPEEEEAAADIEQDDYPVLRVQGEGDYWVEVIMADCQADTCAYAVQAFVLEQ